MDRQVSSPVASVACFPEATTRDTCRFSGSGCTELYESWVVAAHRRGSGRCFAGRLTGGGSKFFTRGGTEF